MWRSLVARFVRDEEVAGSNPVTPTNETEREKNVSFSPFCVERGRGRRRDAEYPDDVMSRDICPHMSRDFWANTQMCIFGAGWDLGSYQEN